MAEGARRRFHAGDAVRRRVLREQRAVVTQGRDQLVIEEASLSQRHVERRSGVALGEDEPVAVGGRRQVGVDAEAPEVSRHEDVHAAHAAAEVRDAIGVRQTDQPRAQ